MTDITRAIEIEIDIQMNSIPVQRLIDKLILIPSKSSEMSRRWFWELLQNASDTSDEVEVKLIIENDFVTFVHFGGPFQIKDALNLIVPETGKRNQTQSNINQIGKFGSGMVSTHILSGLVEAEGIILSEEEYYSFSLTLDRTNFQNKDSLIETVKKCRENFKPNLLTEEYLVSKFPTTFKYHLNQPLAEIETRKAVKMGVNLIIELIPFTLTFLPKIKSISIENKSDYITSFKRFQIGQRREKDSIITFTALTDGQEKLIEVLHAVLDDVETAVLIESGDLKAYPENMPKYFCGFPLIGTEELGLPIPINSFLFKTSQERESIELSPQDKNNRELINKASKLYAILLDKCKELGFKNIFHLTKMRSSYSGAEASKIAFKQDFIPKFKDALNNSEVVVNRNGVRIRFSNFILPSRSGFNQEIFEAVKSFKPDSTCPDLDFENWLCSVDPEFFAINRFGYDRLMGELSRFSNLNSIILEEGKDPIEWLKQVVLLVKEVDFTHFKKYKILPNHSLSFLLLDDLSFAKSLPDELIDIHDELTGLKLGDSLLHPDLKEFHELFSVTKEINVKVLCNRIDLALSKKYGESQNNTSLIFNPLRRLFSWYDGSGLTKDNLKDYFPWFDKKRAILFLETFDEQERDFALRIAQSGKLEALAMLANSSLTSDQLRKIAENPDLLLSVLNGHMIKVDDETFADKEIGDQGEEIVFSDLMKKFPVGLGYEVIWSSRDLNEGRFDFEVRKSGNTIWYIDAKTTGNKAGINGSIPFFMRPVQWEFLRSVSSLDKYVLARVSLKPNTIIKYLKINLLDNLK